MPQLPLLARALRWLADWLDRPAAAAAPLAPPGPFVAPGVELPPPEDWLAATTLPPPEEWLALVRAHAPQLLDDATAASAEPWWPEAPAASPSFPDSVAPALQVPPSMASPALASPAAAPALGVPPTMAPPTLASHAAAAPRASHQRVADRPPPTVRSPVRPLPLRILAPPADRAATAPLSPPSTGSAPPRRSQGAALGEARPEPEPALGPPRPAPVPAHDRPAPPPGRQERPAPASGVGSARALRSVAPERSPPRPGTARAQGEPKPPDVVPLRSDAVHGANNRAQPAARPAARDAQPASAGVRVGVGSAPPALMTAAPAARPLLVNPEASAHATRWPTAPTRADWSRPRLAPPQFPADETQACWPDLPDNGVTPEATVPAFDRAARERMLDQEQRER